MKQRKPKSSWLKVKKIYSQSLPLNRSVKTCFKYTVQPLLLRSHTNNILQCHCVQCYYWVTDSLSHRHFTEVEAIKWSCSMLVRYGETLVTTAMSAYIKKWNYKVLMPNQVWRNIFSMNDHEWLSITIAKYLQVLQIISKMRRPLLCGLLGYGRTFQRRSGKSTHFARLLFRTLLKPIILDWLPIDGAICVLYFFLLFAHHY